MPLGTTLLQSPGCNEGKARNETLGTHVQKQNELRQGAALTASAFVLVSCRCGSWLFVRWESVAPLGLVYAFTTNQCQYDVLTDVSTRKHFSEYVYLFR